MVIGQVPLTPHASEICFHHSCSLPTIYHHTFWTSKCPCLNRSKCDFGKPTVTYLGKQAGQGQVLPLLAKIQAILDLPGPRTRCQLRHFLRIAGYYCGCCKKFADLVSLILNSTLTTRSTVPLKKKLFPFCLRYNILNCMLVLVHNLSLSTLITTPLCFLPGCKTQTRG